MHNVHQYENDVVKQRHFPVPIYVHIFHFLVNYSLQELEKIGSRITHQDFLLHIYILRDKKYDLLFVKEKIK